MAGRAVFQIKLRAWGSVDLGLIHALVFAQPASSVPGLQPPGTGWGLAVLPRSDGTLSSPPLALLSPPVHGVHSREVEPGTQSFDGSALLCTPSTSADFSVSLDTMSFLLSTS